MQEKAFPEEVTTFQLLFNQFFTMNFIYNMRRYLSWHNHVIIIIYF